MLGAGDTKLTLYGANIYSFIQRTVASPGQRPSPVLGTGRSVVISKTDIKVSALRKLIVFQ